MTFPWCMFNPLTLSACSIGLPFSKKPIPPSTGTCTVAVVLGGIVTTRSNWFPSMLQALMILPSTESYSPLACVRSPPGYGRMTMRV